MISVTWLGTDDREKALSKDAEKLGGRQGLESINGPILLPLTMQAA
jgi:hypothetical protein